MKNLVSIVFYVFALCVSMPAFSSHHSVDVELGEDGLPSAVWHPSVQTNPPFQGTAQAEDDCVPTAMVTMGGNCVCGATCTCASLIGATGGIIYLYIKYPAFVVNTLLGQLAPPILIGGAACGVAGCALGYYLKKRTDRRAGVLPT